MYIDAVAFMSKYLPLISKHFSNPKYNSFDKQGQQIVALE